jgi:CRP/FNR family cyclic AMP-dependent transcriptional regulator
MARGTGGQSPGPFPLPVRTDRGPHRDPEPRPPGRLRYLFDIDDELAAGLPPRMRMVARSVVTARVQEIGAGEFDLVPLLAQLQGGLGLLVVEGVIALDVQVGDRTASELVGDGDLIAPWTSDGDVVLLASETFSRALVNTRVAVLDNDFADRTRAWPQVVHALLRRAVRRTMELNVHRAATCHPRADVRIALLLWHLAERWGIVEPDGILVPLPLTHRLIGQLVGAERPSVSHALSRLSSAGLVTRDPNGLVLHNTAAHHIACLTERPEADHAAADEDGAEA